MSTLRCRFHRWGLNRHHIMRAWILLRLHLGVSKIKSSMDTMNQDMLDDYLCVAPFCKERLLLRTCRIRAARTAQTHLHGRWRRTSTILLQMLRCDVRERTDKHRRAIQRLRTMNLHAKLSPHRPPYQQNPRWNDLRRETDLTSRASFPYSRSSSYRVSM